MRGDSRRGSDGVLLAALQVWEYMGDGRHSHLTERRMDIRRPVIFIFKTSVAGVISGCE